MVEAGVFGQLSNRSNPCRAVEFIRWHLTSCYCYETIITFLRWIFISYVCLLTSGNGSKRSSLCLNANSQTYRCLHLFCSIDLLIVFAMAKPTPLIFISHGSTMMMAEESVVTRDWQDIGRKAELRGIKGIVIMVLQQDFTSCCFWNPFTDDSACRVFTGTCEVATRSTSPSRRTLGGTPSRGWIRRNTRALE